MAVIGPRPALWNQYDLIEERDKYTENVLTAAIDAGVKKVICLSTDKAAYPVNAMGTSKAMMEKVIVAKSRTVSPEKTSICCTRYGNVMCSRGSVIPLWIEQIKKGHPITVTEPTMTRFIMSLEEAVELVIFAFQNAQSGDIMVQKGCFILAGIDEKSLLQAVDTAVEMNRDENYGIPVPDYVEENVSTKVVKIIQSYTGVVDKMVWRKEI